VTPVRFRFADFVVSPARRQVLRGGEEVPLIPRYFDLLVLLLQRRGQAVHRREIFESVWNDVVVSDGALSQAVRTLRRALDDDSHDPTYIRTVSRHGYRFAYPGVVEEPDPASAVAAPSPAIAAPEPAASLDTAAERVREPIARWVSAVAGAAAAGVVAGVLGGLLLLLSPGSQAPGSVVVVLAAFGAVVGGLGALGVAGGLAAALSLFRPPRAPALVALAAAGGAAIGFVAHHLARWTLQNVFGRDFGAVGGGFEGLALGAAAGLGYAVADVWRGAPADEGRGRWRTAILTAAACALAGVAATAAGANLTGVSLNTLARAFQGQVQLAPVARLLGEAELGPVTRGALAVYEGAFFGFGLALGFTRRPR
jgi:DNA-binding winged helix-turn-helix (wHTH) protein